MWFLTCSQISYDTLQIANNKGADQTKQKRRTPEDRFSRIEDRLTFYVLPIMTQMGPTCNTYGISNMGP